jgi:hypothetical protein
VKFSLRASAIEEVCPVVDKCTVIAYTTGNL